MRSWLTIIHQLFLFHPKEPENYHDTFQKVLAILVQQIILTLSLGGGVLKFITIPQKFTVSIFSQHNGSKVTEQGKKCMLV